MADLNRRSFWSRIAAAFGIAAAPRVLTESKPRTFNGPIKDVTVYANPDEPIPPSQCYACQSCGVVDFGGQLAPKLHREASGWLCDRCAPAPSRYRVDTGVTRTPLPDVSWRRFHWGCQECDAGTPCAWAKQSWPEAPRG